MERSNAFLVKMEDLVRHVLAYGNIPCYRIDSAIENHINSEGESIDIPVIRIVGFFEDTIGNITNVLNSEFELYQVKNTATDTFSSSTKIYQASLRQNRLDLAEYLIHQPQKFDIHVSSILQDVYSAMYRNLLNGNSSLPEEIKRDYYRIGAFLEMADIEFIKIRNRVNNNDFSATPGTMPFVPAVERNTHSAPAKTASVQEQAQPERAVAEVPAEPVVATALPADSNHIAHIESMEMTVDSFDALGMSINSIGNKNGTANNDYFDLLTSTSSQKATDTYDLVSSVTSTQQPITEVVAEEVEIEPVAETPTVEPIVASTNETEVVDVPAPDASKNGFAAPGEGVNLNIDKIDTFNMNVSGMIEREIIREVGAGATPAAGIPALENKEEENQDVPVNMDENAQMNDAMLKEYVGSSKLVKEVDRMIAERAGAKINDDIDIEGDVERLRFLKVYTLKQLNEKITDNKEDIVAFAEKWIGKDNGGSFDSGICLFYLEYLLVGKKNDPAFSVEYVLKFISDNDYSARYIIPTYNAIRLAAGEPASNNFAHLTLK